jgi:predicted negative regulator of RcsB-dependent stress response
MGFIKNIVNKITDAVADDTPTQNSNSDPRLSQQIGTFVFGQAAQLDASKYQIDNGAGKDANKNMITVLSFVGGIVLVALIAIAIALK